MSTTVTEPLAARINSQVTLGVVQAIYDGARSFVAIRDKLGIPPRSSLEHHLRDVLRAARRVDLIGYDHPGGYVLCEDAYELLSVVTPSGELPDPEPIEGVA